jgi:hypothetical protein
MKNIISFLFLFLFQAAAIKAQTKTVVDNNKNNLLKSETFNGLKFRSIGPALTSGRVVDLAVNPNNSKEYFVAAAAGGVWKTVNGGITYDPVFESEGSFSIGCVVYDPNNTNVIWVGSGENNNQRSASYGDGVYKSTDGGKSWSYKGLPESHHIGRIRLHPKAFA